MLFGIEKILSRQTFGLQQHIQEETNRRILRWLNAPDVRSNLSNALSKRQPGTGEWFITSAAFQTWIAIPGLLWLSGIPGAGKTILSSTIIATLLCRLEEFEAAVLFSFFDFQNASQQKSDALLRALLAQLAEQNKESFQCLRKLHDDCKSGGHQASSDALLTTLTAALTHFPRVFIVVDALDECSERQQMLKYLKLLSEASNTHIIVLSRRERDIELALEDVATQIALTAANVDHDIALYVRHRMAESEDMRMWSSSDRGKVQDKLISKADGMYVCSEPIQQLPP